MTSFSLLGINFSGINYLERTEIVYIFHFCGKKLYKIPINDTTLHVSAVTVHLIPAIYSDADLLLVCFDSQASVLLATVVMSALWTHSH